MSTRVEVGWVLGAVIGFTFLPVRRVSVIALQSAYAAFVGAHFVTSDVRSVDDQPHSRVGGPTISAPRCLSDGGTECCLIR